MISPSGTQLPGTAKVRSRGLYLDPAGAGIMPTICHGSLAPALKRYSETYPNVEIRVVEGLSGTLAEWVLSDKLDFAVCHRPASARGFELRLLVSDGLVLVSGAGKPLARFAPCSLRDVPDLKLVLPSRNHTLRHVLDEQIERGDLRPSKMLEIDGQSAMLQFVAQSDWSTVLPRLALINEFESVRFVINPIVAPHIASDIYEVRSSRSALTLAAARFIALLEAEIQAAPELPKPA